MADTEPSAAPPPAESAKAPESSVDAPKPTDAKDAGDAPTPSDDKTQQPEAGSQLPTCCFHNSANCPADAKSTEKDADAGDEDVNNASLIDASAVDGKLSSSVLDQL
jgi:hypothetical protein